MDPNNSFDIAQEMGYNEGNDSNERSARPYDVTEQIVRMDEIKPLNDKKCKHKTLIPDPNDTIGDSVYHGCANEKCGMGFYISKT